MRHVDAILRHADFHAGGRDHAHSGVAVKSFADADVDPRCDAADRVDAAGCATGRHRPHASTDGASGRDAAANHAPDAPADPVPAVNIYVRGYTWIPSGADHVNMSLFLRVRGLDPSSCTIIDSLEPDDPALAPSSRAFRPLPDQVVALADGVHRFVARCPSGGGEVVGRRVVRVVDGKPERCRGFAFPDAAISISSFDGLVAGVVGTWEGCVTTPWVPPYWVSMSLGADGTYSAVSTEILDGQDMNAMYYGVEADSPQKRYAINDIQASLKGLGQIDIVFGPEMPSRGDLVNIALMGDQLEFEFFYNGYGPVTFQLIRTASAG